MSNNVLELIKQNNIQVIALILDSENRRKRIIERAKVDQNRVHEQNMPFDEQDFIDELSVKN